MNPKDRDELLIRMDETTKTLKTDVAGLKGDVRVIKENHLAHIQKATEGHKRNIGWLTILVLGLYGLLGTYVTYLMTR